LLWSGVRLVTAVPRSLIDQEISRGINQIRKRRALLISEASQKFYHPPTIIPKDSIVLLVLRQAAQEISGIKPEVTVSGPANESCLLNRYGIPTCTYGPVGAGAYAVDEYVEIELILPMVYVYAIAAWKLNFIQQDNQICS